MSLLLVYDFGVDLSGSYVFVGEHLADGVDVSSAAEEQGSVGVTEAVEGNFFSNTCTGDPFFQVSVHDSACESFEDKAGAWFSTEFEGLLTYWECGFGFSLLGTDTDAFTAIWVVLDHAPFKLENVADSESCEA